MIQRQMKFNESSSTDVLIEFNGYCCTRKKKPNDNQAIRSFKLAFNSQERDLGDCRFRRIPV